METPDLEPSQTQVATLRTQCWCLASEVGGWGGGSLVGLALNPHGLLLSELNGIVGHPIGVQRVIELVGGGGGDHTHLVSDVLGVEINRSRLPTALSPKKGRSKGPCSWKSEQNRT